MGQQVSALIDAFDNDAEKEKLANDALNSLVELAKLQIAAFELAISNPNFDAKKIPIDQIISSDSIIQAKISNTPADIGKVINDTFSAFAEGHVADGIAKLVNSGLTLLLGSYSANTSTRDTYVITTGDLGGVFRIDMHFFAYRFTSTQLKESVKEVLAVSIVISSADLSTVSDNTLRVIVQQTYSESTKDEQTAIYEQLKKARDEDKQPSTSEAAHELHRAAAKFARAKPLSLLRGPPIQTVDVTQIFEVETQIGQAQNQAGRLGAWVRASLAHAFGKKVEQISVECYQESSSTSNSRIVGKAEVSFKEDNVPVVSHRLREVIEKSLEAATNVALSELSISNWTLTVE
ncbi:hypothetical protein F5Y19DRAFT_459071 [Xylariaceae sp. FL1651]|nr:hypothetical protein F5Y19DRAFT_459071 [Xylariaceae sp. FL1651]